MKNPLTPARIEPAIFRFVTQHLSHCATAFPPLPPSVHYISLISLFLHHTLCPYIAFTHTHSLRAVCMLIFAIQFTTLRLKQCGVFKIRQQEKHGTMDFQYTGVQNSSLRVQIIADSKTCCGKLVIFNFYLQLSEK